MRWIQGWWVGYYNGEPATGQWIASRFGVTMRAGTEAQIREMIRNRRELSHAVNLPR